MYMMTVCMPIYSRLRPIRCGGTGAGTGVWPARVTDGDGILLGIAAGIPGIPLGTAVGIHLIGMEDSMPDIGAVIGDLAGIILIPVGDGEEVGLIGAIPITVRHVTTTMLVHVVKG